MTIIKIRYKSKGLILPLSIRLSYNPYLTPSSYMKVSISGNIGVGKSTLIDKLSNLGYNVSPEIIDQDGKVDGLLKDYYSNMDKASFFRLQRYFFQMRLMMFQSLCSNDDESHNTKEDVGIVERCPGEDEVFLYNGLDNGIVSQEDVTEFLKEFDNSNHLPDIIVYLYNPKVTGLKENIMVRGRKCETDISEEYLEKVEKRYEDFMELMSKKTKVLFVESSMEKGFVEAETLMEEVKCVFQDNDSKTGKFYF